MVPQTGDENFLGKRIISTQSEVLLQLLCNKLNRKCTNVNLSHVKNKNGKSLWAITDNKILTLTMVRHATDNC